MPLNLDAMLAAPIPDNDVQRVDALRNGFCAYAPREERFDRITRTARRLLNVPIALIAIVEQDEQWFRSVQGLEIAHTPRDISFCGHVVAINEPMCIPDTLADPHFHDNPLVTGSPRIRSYLGWPLEIADGLAVGSLCVIDTMPRTFGREDYEGMEDLAAMAEAELRRNVSFNLQTRVMLQLTPARRKTSLDSLTGCWNVRGFRELLALGIEDARTQNTELAICRLHIEDPKQVAERGGVDKPDALTLLVAQALRRRLPLGGALARLGPSDFCALVPAASALELEDELAQLTFPKISVSLPGSAAGLELVLTAGISWLADLGPDATASRLWGGMLSAHT